MLDNELLETAQFSPLHVAAPKGWLGHVPFAYWVATQVQPRLLVELGTHTGNSYFAFCQAVSEKRLPTLCYAIDTWHGDEHAGFYSDDIFESVRSHNDKHFSGFSYLIRTTFDEAVNSFSDHSIDLLHIDGLHTYEAVKHDFDTWRPKLSDGAIVLFHDTCVREDGFGVWKFWGELTARHPYHIEFAHSSGLGVLQLCSEDIEPHSWLKPENPVQSRLIKDYFSSLGQKCIYAYDLDVLHSRFEERGQYTDKLNLLIEEDSRTIETLNKRIEEKLQVQRELENKIDLMGHELSSIQSTANQLNLKLKNAEAHRDELQQLYSQISESTSWKLTYPIRKILSEKPFLRKTCRRLLKVGWSALTGQLISRTKEHFASRRQAGRLRAQRVEETCLSDAPGEVARAVDIDYSLAVPIPGAESSTLKDAPPAIAVLCHLYYPEMAQEIRRYLSNIPYSFDLYISTTDHAKKNAVEKAFVEFKANNVTIKVLPNRGRDIAPKITGFSDIYASYEYVLHIHSKRSDHAGVLANWRGYLLETLIGSSDTVASVIQMFEQQPQLGIVAAQHFEPVRHWINWGGNFNLSRQLASRMGLCLNTDQLLDFPSGSMFWTRSSSLKPLLDLNLEFDDFAAENDQIDGTLAHAIERLFFYVAEKAGYSWVKISDPHLMLDTSAIIQLNDINDFDSYLRRYNLKLTGEDAPSPRRVPPVPIQSPSSALVENIQGRTLGKNCGYAIKRKTTFGIVTFNNSASDLQRLVQSIELSVEHADLSPEYSICVIDNGEDTSHMLEEYSAVEYLSSEGNVGFGAAHNKLMKHAFSSECDVYIAINPDGMLHHRAVEALLDMMQANNFRAIIEALQFPLEHPKPYDPFSFVTPWVSGACMAIPRCAWEQLGGFDVDFFMYCEDVDLSWRAKANGFTLLTCPSALFMHEVTNRQPSKKTRERLFASGIVLARKWSNPSFESWLVDEIKALGGVVPEYYPQEVPAEWKSFADFSREFSFCRPRWG